MIILGPVGCAVAPREPVTAVPGSSFTALLQLAAIGLVGWVAYRWLERLFEEPRDTFKYIYWQGGRVRHGGITNDLGRREREHRWRWPGGYIEQVGNRTTRSAASTWERRMGF